MRRQVRPDQRQARWAAGLTMNLSEYLDDEQLVAWDRDVAPYLFSQEFGMIEWSSGTAWDSPSSSGTVPVLHVRYQRSEQGTSRHRKFYANMRSQSDYLFWMHGRFLLMDIGKDLHDLVGDLLYLPTMTHYPRDQRNGIPPDPPQNPRTEAQGAP